ncbi:MAG: hypothetical protein LBE31_09190 [Deltaproteobacteria bacterium]|nr:hypothetical protein [Deltaproteobacteria bacterium]
MNLGEMPLKNVAALLHYHTAVDVPTIIASINHMIDYVNKGETVFYHFYRQEERRADSGSRPTGLFFFPRKTGGLPSRLFVLAAAFPCVGSFHEGFPSAMKLSKLGYNAFVLQYRVGGGGTPSVMDLAAALWFIFTNANALGVSTTGNSL